MQRLEGKVAVVTGASRNLGRGVALVLGQERATVYVTGRSVRDEQTTDSEGANIQDVAEQITERGGAGIPVRCDHSVDAQVEALFERVGQEQGRIDILVNNAWGGYATIKNWQEWMEPFWKQPLSRWDVMFRVGVRSHMTSSYFAAPLMMPHGKGLIVNTTVAMEEAGYEANLFYWLSKVRVNRMTYKMAQSCKSANMGLWSPRARG